MNVLVSEGVECAWPRRLRRVARLWLCSCSGRGGRRAEPAGVRSAGVAAAADVASRAI